MSEEIRYLEARSLTNAINKVKVLEPFMLSTFFKRKEMHVADKIDIEIRSSGDNLAQFVAPDAEARLVTERAQRRIQTVSLPRTYEKKVFIAHELQRFRQLGSSYVSSASERVAASNGLILQELQELKMRIERRKEQLACEALVTGKNIITQENVKYEIDYGFKTNEQLISLVTAKKWNATGIKPMDDIDAWQLALQKRNGVSADTMIVGTEVASLLKKDEFIMKQLNNSYYKMGSLDLTKRYGTSGRWLGNLYGLDIYEYTQQYTNAEGSSLEMFPKNQVLLVANGVTDAFKIHYGPSYRITESGLQVLTNEMLVEAKINEAKTFLEWSVEQKSLATIHVPEAIISATVL